MKRYFVILFAAFLMIQGAAFAKSVNWNHSYDEGMQKAKASSKPVVLFFTGSDWCTWCKKLDKEVFTTSEFANAVGDQFVFVELDYPMKGQKNPDNESLKNKFNIRGFPTVVILDSNGNEIARTGYQQGGGKKYAEHLKQISSK